MGQSRKTAMTTRLPCAGWAVVEPASLLALILLWPCIAVAGAERPDQPPTRYLIVVTGGEMLCGLYADGHTYFVTRTLRSLGLQCVGSMTVDDREADLKEALRFATDRAPLVIVTGGLGPTDNDITRETLSDFTGIALREHPDVLQTMAGRFRTSPEQLRSNLRRQTRVPVRGNYLPNAHGTAVGLVFESPESVIVALPGPPRELQAMVTDELIPYLSRRFGTRLPGPSLTLRFVGLGQSEIDQRLKENVALPPDVVISSQFEGGRVDFTFSLSDDTPQQRTRLRELRDQIVKHLGEHIYGEGDTSLEQHVINLLAARGETLALVEGVTGGHVSAALSRADDAERVLAGAYVAPTQARLCRLLGAADSGMQRLAERAAQTAGSGWVLVVGEAGRDGSGVVYVDAMIKGPHGTLDSRRLQLRGTSETAQMAMVTQLLDQLRRDLK